MPFQNLIKHYKGGTGSGDWGHTGRPGKVGGSGGGGGLSAIGAKPDSDASARRAASVRKREGFVRPTDNYMDSNQSPDCEQYPRGCAALTEYTDDGFATVNQVLRKSEGYVRDDWSEQYTDQMTSDIDYVMRYSPGLQKNIAVTRTTTKELFAELEEGDSFTDKGYVSTSIAPMVGGTVLTISVPKGTQGVYLGGLSVFPSEEEYLLPRNSTFVVNSKKVFPNGNALIDVTLTGTMFN